MFPLFLCGLRLSIGGNKPEQEKELQKWIRTVNHEITSNLCAVRKMIVCKICASRGLVAQCKVNFNELYGKNEVLGMPNGGSDVFYYRCTNCGFVFTDHMDDWTADQFIRDIYNDEYHRIDDEYLAARPNFNFGRFCRNFSMHTNQSLLDYGGGSGVFSDCVKNAGSSEAHTFDPFANNSATLCADYDFVTAFEVMEHCVDPLKSFKNLFGHLKPTGLAVISTLCVFEAEVRDRTEALANLAYLQPRGGHVSIYSFKSLDLIAHMNGLARHSLDIGYHIFYDQNYNDPKIFLKPDAR